MRRAKIVSTLGPATDTYDTVLALVDAGMDVARLNMSHGDHNDHRARYDLVRRASDQSERAVGILADLQGPKIRTGRFAGGPVILAPGNRFTITTRPVSGDAEMVGTTYSGLADDVRAGDDLLLDDGKLHLRAVQVTKTDVVCEVVIGGALSDNKGINLPGTAVSAPALSEKDAADLRFALDLGVDFIALSFVRTGADADDVRAICAEAGRKIPIIAKIEKPQAVDNIEEIIAAFDGIMVARGDLGVELPLEQVPLAQKRIIELARRNAKPVIVATQVLESMITNPRPTRAEASDCANAVLDGADAIMLSGETSVGAWPIEAVSTMATIIERTEDHGMERIVPLGSNPHTMNGVVTKAAAEVAEALDAVAMVTFTQTGDTARRLSRLRRSIPLLAFTPEPGTRSRLAASWGVETFIVPFVTHTDDMVRQVDEALLAEKRARTGELVVIVAGSPPGTPGGTNAVRVHKVGTRINY